MHVSGGAPDNRGREFVIVFMENMLRPTQGSPDDLQLFVTTARPYDVSVTVTAPGISSATIDSRFEVQAGQVNQIFLPYDDVVMKGSSRDSRAVYVTATDEISVYGVNNQENSADAFLAKPVDVLGTNYYTVSYSPSISATQLAIGAAYDQTSVSIKLPDVDSLSVRYEGTTYTGGATITISMDKLDTIQLQSAEDLTGAHITSDKPVSVFSGNQKTRVGSGGTKDHMCVHLPPVETWGMEFVTAPTPSKTIGDYFRVIASEDDTDVTITEKGDYNIPLAGGYHQVSLASNKHYLITTNKPVMVAQIVKTQTGSDKGDPSMLIIPPTVLFSSDYTFTTPKYAEGSPYSNFLTVILPYSERRRVYLDDVLISRSGWIRIRDASPDLAAKLISVGDGTHRVRHESPIVPMGVYLYGYESFESYAFTPGMLLAPINVVSMRACVLTTIHAIVKCNSILPACSVIVENPECSIRLNEMLVFVVATMCAVTDRAR